MDKTITQSDTKQIRELLVGRKVVRVSRGLHNGRGVYEAEDRGLIELDNGTQLTVTANVGCGGCASGWYSLDHLEAFDNVITAVKVVDEKGEGEYDWGQTHKYSIFVYAGKKNGAHTLLSVSGDDGNGYYGTGFEIHVDGI